MAASKSYAWKDPKALMTAALWVLGIQMFLAVTTFALILGRPLLLRSFPYPYIWTMRTLGHVHVVMGLAAVIFIAWVLRASKNAHFLKGRKLTNSPWFAALWWYCIPFMSLYMPYGALGEIWDASAMNRERRNEGRWILGTWWGAYLVGNILSYVLVVLLKSLMLYAATLVFEAVQIAAFAYVVWKISKLQVESRALLEFSDRPALGVLQQVTG